MELLEIGLEPLHDFDRIGDRGFVDVDLLEAANERAVLLEILPVFLVGRRADAAQNALRQRGLQKVRGVHRAARGGARANHRMDLVDEENRVLVILDFLHDLLQALFEIAAIARAGEQRAHVEREHRRPGENLRHLVRDDLAREAFGDRGLADAGIADEQGIILLPAAQNLNRAQHFRLAADQRVDAAVARLPVEIDAIGLERAFLLAALAVAALAAFAALAVVLDAARAPAGVRKARTLGDAMADEIDGVIARHVLLLQEIDGVAFALGEQRDKNIGAADVFAAGRLDADNRPLHDPLEARRSACIHPRLR